MTIRGGGHPKQTMVLTPVSRLGPPPRSFAADAHDGGRAARPAFIYHLGDSDPSGENAAEVIERELREYAPGAESISSGWQ